MVFFFFMVCGWEGGWMDFVLLGGGLYILKYVVKCCFFLIDLLRFRLKIKVVVSCE